MPRSVPSMLYAADMLRTACQQHTVRCDDTANCGRELCTSELHMGYAQDKIGAGDHTVSSTRKCSVSTATQVARKPRQNTDVL